MLQSLLSQQGTSGLVLINDTLEQRARLLLDSLTNTCANRGHIVHILGYDREEGTIRKCFPPSTLDRIAIHDTFRSPDKCSPSMWVERLSKEKEPFTLVIDSLSTALIYHPFDDVYMGLLCLLRRIKSLQMIVALLHTDVHEEHEVDKLCHLAATTLTPYAHDSVGTLGCKIVHKKPSGRVVRDDEEFVLKPDLSITDIKKVAQKQDAKPFVQQPDPTANLTFNLRLSEEEKAAKDNLVLPYIKKPSSSTGKGEITYVMEREDDFDEEDDPDDDLNF
ncbi:elongator complex protein 5 isoform X1 [Dermacentor andersoni]|uniref:elongator complex protein 5 isoform X1 n=1 Tax=Dermacentor andersoni TaxID=34620 RepID=UPI00215565CF|nr:elongator complex protein 5-like isoform X1 [Dermacentor andersoni]